MMSAVLARAKGLARPFAHKFRYHVIREAFSVDSLFDREVRRTLRPPSTFFTMLTNICNARCTFCQYPKHQGEKGVMDFDTFKKAVDSFRALGARKLNLTPNNGDPLIDKGLIEKLRYARGAGIEFLMFSTNGILLKRGDLTDRLVELMDDIRISFPGLDRENYRTVYGVDKASDLEEGLIKLAESKKRARRPVTISLDFRVDRTREEVFADPGMQRLRPYIEDGTLTVAQWRCDEMFDWSGAINPEDLTGIMKMKPVEIPQQQLPCNRIFSDLNGAVLQNGNLRLCYCGRGLTNEGPLVVGNINEKSVGELFGNSLHRKLLREWTQGKIPSDCQRCAIYQPSVFSWWRIFALFLEVIASPSWWRAKCLVRRPGDRTPSAVSAAQPPSV